MSNNVEIAVEERDPEPPDDVIARLVTLIKELRAIPGIHARIDITVTVTAKEVDR